jgi:ABC-2 type transport system ATP-binding protein
VKRYRGTPENAVDGISFEVAPGQLFCLLGPNGAGKTTTVSVLITALAPTSGTVIIAGWELPAHEVRVRRELGVVFQQPSLDLNLTAEENIRMHAVLYGLCPWRPAYRLMPAGYRRTAGELAAVMGIAGALHRPARSLSGGMRRKLEIVRALMHQPRVLFLDEPTAGLDPQSRRATWELVEQLAADGVTVVLTTHHMEEAERLASRVVVVDRGRVIASGSPEELMSAGAKNTIRFSAKPGLHTDELLWALPEEYSVTEEPAGSYRVDGEVTPHILAAVTAWCAALDVIPEDLVIEKHSLEDVFLALTGKALRS